MYQIEFKDLTNKVIFIKVAKNEKSASSVARYWLKKLDDNGMPASAKLLPIENS